MNQQDVFSLKIEVEQLVPPLFFFFPFYTF